MNNNRFLRQNEPHWLRSLHVHNLINNFVSPIPEQPTPLVGDCNTILYTVRVLRDRDGSDNPPASTKLLISKSFVLAGRLSEPSRSRSTLTVYKKLYTKDM